MDVSFIKSADARHYPDLNLPEPADFDVSEDKDSGWLISFVDLLTLLLTFFVLLLAFSHLPQDEQSHQAATTAPISMAAIHRNNAVKQAPTQDGADTTPKQLPNFSVPQDIKDKVEIVATPTEVNLVIKDDVLFDEGSTSLKPIGQSVLDRIAQMLSQNDYPISVEGHTDNIPIHTSQFPSNWELSTFRATTVTRYFIQSGIAINRLRVIGYADTQPIADNNSEEGRARNRHVSLVVHINESVDSSAREAMNN